MPPQKKKEKENPILKKQKFQVNSHSFHHKKPQK
jgi:hypothetical protein